jgi:hypothetical protein
LPLTLLFNFLASIFLALSLLLNHFIIYHSLNTHTLLLVIPVMVYHSLLLLSDHLTFAAAGAPAG